MPNADLNMLIIPYADLLTSTVSPVIRTGKDVLVPSVAGIALESTNHVLKIFKVVVVSW